MTTCNSGALGPSRDQHIINPTIKGDVVLDSSAIQAIVNQICLAMVPCITDVYRELFANECDLFVINKLEVRQELILSDLAQMMLIEQLAPRLKWHIEEVIKEIKTLEDIILLNPKILNATFDADTKLQFYNFLLAEPQLGGLVAAICTEAQACILAGVSNGAFDNVTLNSAILNTATITGGTLTQNTLTGNTLVNNTFTGELILGEQAKTSLCSAVQACVMEWINTAVAALNLRIDALEVIVNRHTSEIITLQGAVDCINGKLDPLLECGGLGVPLVDCDGNAVTAGFAVVSCADLAALVARVVALENA